MTYNSIAKLIAIVAMIALLLPAVAGEVITTDVEVRGEIMNLDNGTNNDTVWDAYNCAMFWYDLDDDLQTEMMWITDGTITAPVNGTGEDRTIDENCLHYTTHAIWQEYELHSNEGLTVESDNTGGDDGYWLEGWMAEEYVAIDNNSDKLSKLLVEFEDDDKKTLAMGEEWYLGGGFSLTAVQIDLEGDKVLFTLTKDDVELDTEVVSTGGSYMQERVYTYTADIGNEEDIPVFSCYVDAVFRGTDSNIVQVMYVFLIDDEVMEIDSGDTYGVMEVTTASKSGIVLRNDEDTIDLDTDSVEHIMGNMYFKIADDDDAIRFYPFVRYTVDTSGEGADCPECPKCPDVNSTPCPACPPCPIVTPEVVIEYVNVTVEPDIEEPAKKAVLPGFEAWFAIAGLLAVAALVLRQRK